MKHPVYPDAVWTHESSTPDTREQLLATVERLFAERGFAGVSVRMIAAEANVNWSLVGYYFRGKDGLLAEIYRRHCSALNQERLRLLADARRAGPRLESVIAAFVRPALAEIHGHDGDAQFSRLRAMVAAEDAPRFAQLVADNFDASSRTFVAALRECLPHLSRDAARLAVLIRAVERAAGGAERNAAARNGTRWRIVASRSPGLHRPREKALIRCGLLAE